MPIYRDLSDNELIEKFAQMDYYDPDLCALICERADLAERWARADGESFEAVVEKAAEKLGVEIYR